MSIVFVGDIVLMNENEFIYIVWCIGFFLKYNLRVFFLFFDEYNVR